ncbi:MAG: lytic transglycosylase domain-containing protein [Gammaproteobacteria bacterium]
MNKHLSFFVLGAVLGSLPAAAAADIYKYVDQHGRVHLTDRPSHSGFKRLVKTWKGWEEATINYRGFSLNRKKFEPTIASAAKTHRLPPALLHAVIRAESAYDPEAVSSAGAVGLMQLMPGTAERYGVRNRRDPTANVAGGTRYLRDLLDMFDNDVMLALAAYNAGENAVLNHGRRIPPYAETQTYVQRVLRYYNEFKQSM